MSFQQRKWVGWNLSKAGHAMTCFLKAAYTVINARPSMSFRQGKWAGWNLLEVGRSYVLLSEKNTIFAAKFMAHGKRIQQKEDL